MSSQIRIYPQRIGNYRQYCKYYIFINKQKVGTISFIKKNRILIIGYLKIFEYCRGNHYGYQVIDYLLSHYKINCIVGQSLYDARGFWNKCIKKFNGQRRNISICENCSSSFVIPKYPVSKCEMIDLLNIGYEIE